MWNWDGISYDTKEEYTAAKEAYGSIMPYNINPVMNQHRYTLLSADADKLPTHDLVGPGSRAIAVDTLAIYLYDAANKVWYTHTS